MRAAVRLPLNPDPGQEKSKPYARIEPKSARGPGRLFVRWQRPWHGPGSLFPSL